ncbi:Hypothetical protein NTJ_00409 [Nesidiocoris tenuis]|uniref:Uncharacterized protein n=1 Tax=Nesidiocoris tenuis TaxID=355587 RepID=A0ABN7A6P3_9HEMI|nr:Hypothetical protein NTJ_00409 [Nesidiocoris tenuis]
MVILHCHLPQSIRNLLKQGLASDRNIALTEYQSTNTSQTARSVDEHKFKPRKRFEMKNRAGPDFTLASHSYEFLEGNAVLPRKILSTI